MFLINNHTKAYNENCSYFKNARIINLGHTIIDK